MDWQIIINRVRQIKEQFDKSYKCLNVDRHTKQETIVKHINILLEKLEEIRVIFNVHYSRLTAAHKTAAEAFFLDTRQQLLSVALKKNIDIKIPNNLHEKIIFFEENSQFKSMPQTAVEFLRTASSLIPDFDGKAENLRSFIDALELVDSIKESHESIAVSLAKTKLKGAARNLITNEVSLAEIVATLKRSVKGEWVEVIIAKLMNLKQKNKTANDYTNEVAELTKSLEGAYITDGLPNELAGKYSTQQAIKAMTKNCSIEKVKVIMEAGTFNRRYEIWPQEKWPQTKK